MHFALNTLYWVLFVVTFLLIINQLCYQEHSMIFSWYKQAPGYHVLWIMLIFFAVTVSIALVINHDYRNAACVFLLALAWLIFFLLYARMIEIDVENNNVAGDLPDGPGDIRPRTDKYADALAEDALNRMRFGKTNGA